MSSRKPNFRLRPLRMKVQFSVLLSCTVVVIILLQAIYLIGFSNLTTQRAMATATRQMTQVAKSIDEAASKLERSSSIITYSDYVQEILISSNPKRKHELYPYIMELITGITTSNPDIYSIFLLNNDMRKISDPLRNDDGMTDALVRDYDIRSSQFVKPIFADYVQGYHDYFYAYVFPIFHSYNVGDGSKIGCGILTLNMHELTQLVQADGATKNSQFLLLDSNNRVIVSNNSPANGEVYTDIFWNESDKVAVNDSYMYYGERSIAQFQTIESTGWKIVSIIPISELTADVRPVFLTGLAVSLLMILLMIFLIRLTSRNVSEPVEGIAEFLEQTSKTGDLQRRLVIPYSNESGTIAEHVNMLLERVEQITQENIAQQTALFEARLEEKQAQILAMQSQINPHFLYNTLNCLSSIGLAYDAMEVVTISNAMSDIFRYSIKGGNIALIKQELDCINKYLRIMDARYPGRFLSVISIDDDILNCCVLKMTLQPIVENAMYHGLEQVIGQGHLYIEGKRIGESEVQFIVQDDGKGMSPQELSDLKNHIFGHETAACSNGNSIGLRNIYKRICLQYGSRYGLDIESKEHEGTKVILRLPLISYKPEDVEHKNID